MKLEIRKRATNSIVNLGVYIALEGYPVTAEKYTNRIYEFITSIADFPLTHSICKRELWAKRSYRCAIFEGLYIIPYKIKGDTVIIMNVVHGSRIR